MVSGNLVGARLKAVLIVDDVTAGTAIREVMTMINAAEGATLAAALIALDRQERGQGELSAIQEVERDFGITVASIVGLNQVLDYVLKLSWRNTQMRLLHIRINTALSNPEVSMFRRLLVGATLSVLACASLAAGNVYRFNVDGLGRD